MVDTAEVYEVAAAAKDTWLARGVERGDEHFLEAFADVDDIARGRGAVVTYSSNFGRWIYWLRLPEVRLGRFLIANLSPESRYARLKAGDE